MNKKISTKQIVQTGLFLAIEIIFQILGNYLQLGPVNINLSLIAVILAAVIVNPLSGAILGLFNGLLALVSPSTLAIFMPINPLGTVVICLLKCAIAGLVAGLVFNLLKKKNQILALVMASILVPVINTGIFCLGSLIFFRPFLESGVGEAFPNIGAFLIFGVIGWNFIFELLSSLVLGVSVGTVLLKREKANQ